MTGTVAIMEISGNLYAPLQGSVADGLLVNLGANNDVTVTGTATVTATNLDVQIGGSDTVTVTATNLDVQIGGSDTVAVSHGALTELAAAINSNLVDVNIVSGAGSGGTALADDADFTAGTTNGTPAVGFYQSSVTACTDGDACVIGITAQRTVKTTLFSAAGTELTTGTDYTHNAALTADSTAGPAQVMLAKDFDGSALPSAVSAEGDAVLQAGSLSGVAYVMLVSEDGAFERGTSTTPLIVGDGTGALNVICDSGCSGGTQYTEDAAAAADPVGTAVNLIRADTPGTIATTNGDNVAQRGTNYGAAYVQVVSSSGSFIDTFGGSGGTAIADETTFTAGTTAGTPIFAVFDDAASNTMDEDEVGSVRMTAARSLNVNLTNTSIPVAGSGAHDSAFSGNPNMIAFESKDFDGSALPNAVSAEAETVRASASLSGVQYVMVVNEDGSLERGTATTPTVVSDGSGAMNVIIDSSATLTVNSHAVTNAGTFATQVDGAALTALQLIDDPVFADDAAFTVATSKVNVAGFIADDTSTDSIDEGDTGAARMALDRILYQRPGGASVHYRTAAGSTEDEHEIKATAGILYSVLITNTNAAARYVRCYNLTAANTTPGTSTVFWGAAIPGATTGAGFTYEFPSGLTFDTALTCAFTTGAADTDVAEVAANEIKATYTFR
jgi:hypothetical protein